jgi:hypothetical protein
VPIGLRIGFSDGTKHFDRTTRLLIDADGTVVALPYGRHAGDRWSVDQLLDFGRKES